MPSKFNFFIYWLKRVTDGQTDTVLYIYRSNFKPKILINCVCGVEEMFECDCPLDGLSVEVLSFQSSHFIIQWRGQTSPVATGFFLEINLLLSLVGGAPK